MPFKVYKDYNKYLKLILFFIIVYLIFLLIKPFIAVILGSMILAYAFYPFYKKINLLTKNTYVSSALTTIVIFLLIVLPLIFILNVLTLESISVYNDVKGQDFSKVISKALDERFSKYAQEIVNRIVLFFVEASSKIILSIPQIALNFFLLFFLVFYFLKDGALIVSIIKSYLPFSNKELIYHKFELLTKALIYGSILIAVIQGILAIIGFFIFGISSPILLGVAVSIASFIPMIGTALIWLPVGLFTLIQGNVVSGLGIILFGLLLVSTIDNIVRPYFIGSKAKVHPAIILLGVLGGLKLFGFTGIMIGPLFLALALELIKENA